MRITSAPPPALRHTELRRAMGMSAVERRWARVSYWDDSPAQRRGWVQTRPLVSIWPWGRGWPEADGEEVAFSIETVSS